ncbi:Os07g0239802 [Oryza sativa Japonica Group]|uniref:Os07g0239802 protein n=1 Tax=Oryza sativa subsp. japonica TaxID=39947 RepID=A0A0P0X4L5_ORYSJ|nr:Os07g0239802 [Oryza sativa Japonica Group]
MRAFATTTHPHPRASSLPPSHLHHASAAATATATLSERGCRISHRWICPQGSEGHESSPPSSHLQSPLHHRLPLPRPIPIALCFVQCQVRAMVRTPGTRREIGSGGSATTVPTYGDDLAKPNLINLNLFP